MDKKTSLLINEQTPEFVREEYPKFIAFVKAYYEFLEKEQIVNGLSQKNDLTQILKRIRNIGDVDESLDLFEEQFYNTFIPFLPKDAVVDKDFLIKNVLPLYRSKGTMESFGYLFRLLFGEEIEIEFPRDNILKASSGKWVIENTLRTTTSVYSLYIGDNSTRIYFLPYEISLKNLEIYVDGSLQEEVTNFIYKKELKKIVFNVAPSDGSSIKIVYLQNFDTTFFNSCLIVGQTSGSSAIVERVGRKNIGGLNLFQFFINSKNITSDFINGEVIKIEKENFNFYLECFSEIEKLNIIQPGKNYKVGDKLIFKGTSSTPPIAIVSKVSSGNLENIRVKVGYFGSGYKVGNNVWANNITISSNDFLAFIDSVDTTGFSSPNTIHYVEDLISDYSNIIISSETVGEIGNTNTVISQALTEIIVTNLGPATNVIVSRANLKPSIVPTFEANSTIITGNTKIQDIGAIGLIQVDSPGYGYSVGDQVIFSNDYYFSGQQAEAYVSAVSPVTGGVLKVTVQNGGYQYSMDYKPKLTIDSVSGVGCEISVSGLMGEGALFEYDSGDGLPGKILEVDLLQKGTGLLSTPIIDMRYSGDGKATITSQTTPSYVTLPGRWISSDGIISSDECKLQGENYYIDFSYVVASKVEFTKYKNIVKDLLNPSGSINYARYVMDQDVDVNLNISIIPRFEKQLVGTVNVVSNQVGIWGTNTYFLTAQSLGNIQPGSYIKVNSEIRVVNNIINNTYLTVSNNFTYNANDMIVSTVNVYNTLANEVYEEIRIESPQIVITTESLIE